MYKLRLKKLVFCENMLFSKTLLGSNVAQYINITSHSCLPTKVVTNIVISREFHQSQVHKRI